MVKRSMMRAARERQAYAAQAAAALAQARSARCAAYARFNQAGSGAELESAIWELGALDARCGALHRALQALTSADDIQGEFSTNAASHTDHARRGRRAAGAAAAAAAKAH